MDELKDRYEGRLTELNRRRAENDLMLRQVKEMLVKIEGTTCSLKVGQEALLFLERVASARRGEMKGRIEDVETRAMRLIYGPDYRVELTYSMKNNRSHMDIEMVRDVPDGEVRRDPTTGCGGGVADTISVPLRLMVLIGSKQTDRVCALDECWKHVDPERVNLVGEFLRVLTEQLGMQLIMLSHHEMMREFADRACFVTEKDGRSTVEML